MYIYSHIFTYIYLFYIYIGCYIYINIYVPLVQSDIKANKALGSSNARQGILDYANEV